MRRLLILLALPSLFLAACEATNHSSKAERPRETRSQSTTTTPPPDNAVDVRAVGPRITLTGDACAGCPLRFMQSARLDGDLQGTLTGAGAVDLDRSRFASAATFVFRGAAGECGSGTAVIHRFEVGAASGGELRWEIAPGFGSGALTHLTGGGAGTFVESPPTSDQVASSWSGRISCREPLDVPMLDARPSGTAVTAQVHYPMPPVGAPACDNKDCVFPSTWEPAYTGDWTGGSHAAGTAVLGAPSASGVPYTAVAVERFTGSIADCGSGSVLIRSVSEFDGVRATTRWEIVANFASGDLLRTHGRGDASSRREADGAYAGRLRGAVSCT